MKELNSFIGRWITTGKTVDGKKVTGYDTYEWMQGSKFIIHTVDVMIDGEPVKSMEIIGQGEHQNEFTSHSFDNNGSINISIMHFKNNQITIVSERERFKGEITAMGKIIEGKWEQPTNNAWTALMDIKLEKED